jgi:hypothetical protein
MTALVGTAMDDSVGHRLKQRRVDFPVSVEIPDAADTAHGLSLFAS